MEDSRKQLPSANATLFIILRAVCINWSDLISARFYPHKKREKDNIYKQKHINVSKCRSWVLEYFDIFLIQDIHLKKDHSIKKNIDHTCSLL